MAEGIDHPGIHIPVGRIAKQIGIVVQEGHLILGNAEDFPAGRALLILGKQAPCTDEPHQAVPGFIFLLGSRKKRQQQDCGRQKETYGGGESQCWIFADKPARSK